MTTCSYVFVPGEAACCLSLSVVLKLPPVLPPSLSLSLSSVENWMKRRERDVFDEEVAWRWTWESSLRISVRTASCCHSQLMWIVAPRVRTEAFTTALPVAKHTKRCEMGKNTHIGYAASVIDWNERVKGLQWRIVPIWKLCMTRTHTCRVCPYEKVLYYITFELQGYVFLQTICRYNAILLILLCSSWYGHLWALV
jgi:hypothetical protein